MTLAFTETLSLTVLPIFTITAQTTGTLQPSDTFTDIPTLTLTLQPSDTATSIPTINISNPEIGSIWMRLADGTSMVYVPGGEFTMGMTIGRSIGICHRFYDNCIPSWYQNEEPEHKVFLDAFWIDRTEVTNGMYSRCVQSSSCQAPSDIKSVSRNTYYGNIQYDNFPVINVDWNQASDYCRWVGARLPTEAEWEKAARGPNGYVYPWGNLDPTHNLANFANQSPYTYCDTISVGSFPGGKSIYGANDLLGNVEEWVADWYVDNYYSSSSTNPQGPVSGISRVVRSGSYTSVPTWFSSALRYGSDPKTYNMELGFRCSRSQ